MNGRHRAPYQERERADPRSEVRLAEFVPTKEGLAMQTAPGGGAIAKTLSGTVSHVAIRGRRP